MNRSPLPRLRRRYGAGPWHLAGHLIALAIGHDLILLPAYSVLDRSARSLLARLPRRRPARVPMVNHLRAPALISGLLLLIYAPLISGRADYGYRLDSGHPAAGYLRNWLLISAALFLGSGLIYLARVLRAAARS